MKRILNLFLAILLVLSTLLCVVSCSDKDYKEYSISGLHFTLPKDMKETNVNYASISYWNGEAEFLADAIPRDVLLTEYILDKDITAQEFAEVFIKVNGYDNVEKTYDEARDAVILSYVYEQEEEYYCDFIIRNDSALYLVTMCCDVKYMEKYKPIFAEWISDLSIDK